MARQVLAQPVCASSARERNWSVYGKIKTAESSRMGHERPPTSASTATRRCNLKEKLQYAGYKQEAVGWNTDELLTSSRLRPTPGYVVLQLSPRVTPPGSRIHRVEGRSEYAYSRAYSAPK